MIVLSEATEQARPSPSARDLWTATEAAKLVGCRVYYVPSSFEASGTADEALWHVPEQEHETPGVWLGYTPAVGRYEEVYRAALARRIRLLNTPEQSRLATELDRWYPLLEDLTPRSIVVQSADEARVAGAALGFPVFVKGVVRSEKERGWSACVAATTEELAGITAELLGREHRARGRVVVRELVALRHTRTSDQGFPLSREFRVFSYDRQVLAYGYYWEGDDDLSVLDETEEQEMLGITMAAAERAGVSYLAVDVGQRGDGCWTVIEIGDAQFCGLSRVNPLALWSRLSVVLDSCTTER